MAMRPLDGLGQGVQVVRRNDPSGDSIQHDIPGFALRQIDDHTFEVDISKEQNLNELFARFTVLGIEVLSMRNKVNRLEEIFMRLVENRATNA